MHDEVIGGLGFVGYLTGANLEFIESFWKVGIVPVASCLGLGATESIYTINADHMARSLCRIHSCLPADLSHRRCWRAQRHESDQGCFYRRCRGSDPPEIKCPVG